MKVKRNTLLLLACLVWGAAGFNILRIGLSARIGAYLEERHFFWKFFDGKSFAIMAVMMTGGIGLRSSGLAPERFIAVFYTGLGASLLLAGLLFAGRAAVRPQLRQSAPCRRRASK